jgi:hypothetical protein
VGSDVFGQTKPVLCLRITCMSAINSAGKTSPSSLIPMHGTLICFFRMQIVYPMDSVAMAAASEMSEV